jgi:hypothetical protein
MKVPLYRIAHVRSGDKGNTAIVGVFAYTRDFYPLLAAQLTSDQVDNVYGAAVTGKVSRYEVPSIDALNFTLEGALGGGVSRSLSLDTFGKALCARLLSVEIQVPDRLADQLRDRKSESGA